MTKYFMPHKIKTLKTKSTPSIEDNPDRQADIEFYKSRRWRSLRKIKLRQDPVCECPEQCGKLAEQVHHILDRKARPDLAYDLDNLQSLTCRCHSRITRQRQLNQTSS